MGVTIEEVLFYLRSKFAVQELGFNEPLERLIDAVSYIIPNLSVFDFKIEAAHGLVVAWGRIWLSFGYGAAYVFLLSYNFV